MCLFREFGGTPDDTVATLGNIGNHSRTVGEKLERDMIADSYRIGLFASVETVIAAEATVYNSAFMQHYAIPTTRGTNH